MKKSTINIAYDEEKLSALRLFLTQKNLDLDKELDAYLDRLFSRHVPQNVRDYLDLKGCAAPEKPIKHPAKAIPAEKGAVAPCVRG